MKTPQIDLIENWLDTIGISHSNSQNTRINYRPIFGKFLTYIGKDANEIIQDYESSDDRHFKRMYGDLLKSWISELRNSSYATRTINTHINVVKSFFKYNDLPLSYLPVGKGLVEFHNRDIQKEEIEQILEMADFREKAFFCMIAQTGLRPETLTKLKIEDIEGLLEQKTPTPALINVRQEATKGAYQEYFTFAPEETIRYLKAYLKTRKTPVTSESYLFCMYEDESKPARPGVFSHLFRRIVMRLQKDHLLNFKTKTKDIDVKTKNDVLLRKHISRNELRLYNLRKFFRKYAGQAGADFVNFWMGHTSVLGVDLHYFSRDVEHHRQMFKEKAMPFLRLDSHTPTENEKAIEELKVQLAMLNERLTEKDREIAELKQLAVPMSNIVMIAKKLRMLDLVSRETGHPVAAIDFGTEKELDEKEREQFVKDKGDCKPKKPSK